ncbi:glycosyltransferase family 4 protein [Candidatus Nitrospira neomarina]|uniref:Glycosyltransferase family 4 protein n=1 Tax=Candidatus Nitrospira neomarina TaxID=3020899 RepID=A0AA96GL25_9BACT|nr:glycosyltransferase family 4 protein [Candidatus Nitrospira neomarina]WNM60274.1 glycosyltransferase family 4 protein [Candidatus Nitrospira neomarina]
MGSNNLRILAVTNLYPSQNFPTSGTFVEQQIKGLREVGINVDVLVVERAGGGMKEYLGLRKRLLTRCESFCPDIVHSMYGGVMANVTTRVVRDRPTVVSFCGSDLLGELLSGYLRKIVSGFGVRASWRAARRATGVVVKSRNLLDSLPKDINLSKVRIIPNGIDLVRFKPIDQEKCRKQLGWNNNNFHVLFPTNLGDPRKRFNLAKSAVETLNNSSRNFAEIHQLRGVSHDMVPIWLNASDVVLLTSLHEGSPNIIKEALACNIPVVSVDVGDVKERIHKIEGCYIGLPDPGDLAEKLHLVKAGNKRVSGRNCMEELSLEKVAIRLRNLYEELL